MTKYILICEDAEQVATTLRTKLEQLVARRNDVAKFDIITTQLGAQQLPVRGDATSYDLVLLDYFAPDGNFHKLQFEKIGSEKVIAISSIERYNDLALERGVQYSITKVNPLTDEKATEIIQKAEHILYDSAKLHSQPSHNFDNTASS